MIVLAKRTSLLRMKLDHGPARRHLVFLLLNILGACVPVYNLYFGICVGGLCARYVIFEQVGFVPVLSYV
jgi:hypothetical protein